MKKALIAVGAVVVGFAMGLAGVYFAMPVLSPATVERVQIHLDSFAAADSLARLALADSRGLSPDGTNRPPESLAVTLPDSLMRAQPDSFVRAQPDSLADAGSEQDTPRSADERASDETTTATEDETAIQDSLAVLQRTLEGLLKEKGMLLAQVEALQEQSQTQQTQQTAAQELSATLAKLEDKELAGVVEQLDVAVLEVLYTQASGRNRARLLQAMRSEVAASFVNNLVQPGRAVVTPPPDTTSSKEAAGSEPESINK